MRHLISALAVTGSLLLSIPAHATDYLTFGAGSFDVLDDTNSANFSLEYRATAFKHYLLPMVGVQANSDGGVYGYAGINGDFFLTDNIVLTPNFAVGAYSQGDSKDLGGALEFRSGLELGYQFESQQRVSVAFNHISNAGIYDHNPGEENLMLLYSHPIGDLFGIGE